MSKWEQQYCYICGKPAECREHIPPSGIFSDPKPTDLITVPSCKKCNESSKLDDEYFRWFVATASGKDSRAKRLIKDRVLVRFRNRPALLNVIMSKAMMVNVHSKGGIHLGRQPGFGFDRTRIQRTVDKIVRGLFWHEKAYRLGEDYIVNVFVLNPDVPEPDIERIVSLPVRDIGSGVFSYRYGQCIGNERISIWLLMFFDQTLIMTMTDEKAATSSLS